ncbi:hypothetical protein SDC9_200211 [bioreactor metagenome]|uniref:Uncharacterized protein n=1 Tax=bioreactor metagenome TaxID=1076179 RepID=A0A645IQE1_9ZZZZ
MHHVKGNRAVLSSAQSNSYYIVFLDAIISPDCQLNFSFNVLYKMPFTEVHPGVFLKNDSFMVTFFTFNCHLKSF